MKYHILSNGINNRKILYFTFDETEASIDDLISTYESEVIRSPIKDAGRVFLFLDKIQKNKESNNKEITENSKSNYSQK